MRLDESAVRKNPGQTVNNETSFRMSAHLLAAYLKLRRVATCSNYQKIFVGRVPNLRPPTVSRHSPSTHKACAGLSRARKSDSGNILGANVSLSVANTNRCGHDVCVVYSFHLVPTAWKSRWECRRDYRV